MKRLLPMLFLTSISTYIWAHAEHDKPRYVASTGVDEGVCEVATKPCKTISYAVEHANKGDIVLVAAGQYIAKDVNEALYLTSTLVKIKAGYSTEDNFKKRHPESNLTYISGIPLEYKETVASKGFQVITDSKAMTPEQAAELKGQMATVAAMSSAQSNLICEDGKADRFNCNNVDLLAHVPYPNFDSPPGTGNDIWGHVDLNTGIEYALIGVKTGVVVFDLSNPTRPKEVGYAPGIAADWRDIKTYQYYSETDQRWYAYAYASTDGARGGLAIIDLSGLPESIELVDTDYSNSNVHNIYISNVDYSTGVAINGRTPHLHVMGSNQNGGAYRSYSLQNPRQLTTVYYPADKTRMDYTHDGAATVITDERAGMQCNQGGGECDIFVDFNEQEMLLWDQTVPSDPKKLSSTTYSQARYVHSGWWTEDNKYIFLHDELDEQQVGNLTRVYVFNVENLEAPFEAGRFEGTTKAIDHNGFVRGNRYYMSNYQRGLTILDITNPTLPEEVGYFDTYPVSDSAQFAGAWGVYPFLPSGNILISDIGSGLFVLKENTRYVAQGRLQFSDGAYNAAEGLNATVEIERVGGTQGEVTVQYETRFGSAGGNDFTSNKGTITWADGDDSAKTIEILIETDTLDDEPQEFFFVTLFDPKGGATLGKDKMTRVNIVDGAQNGVISFDSPELTIYEGVDFSSGSKTYDINVSRTASATGAVSVNVLVDDETDVEALPDISLSNAALSWADGDFGTRTVQLTVNDDSDNESLETIVLSLETESADVYAQSRMSIRLLDDESNNAPTITTSNHSAIGINSYDVSQLVSVIDDNEDLVYEWTIASMPSNGELVLSNASSLNAMMTSTAAGDYVLNLKVTDPFGVSANADVTVTVLGIKNNNNTVSGSSMSWLFMLGGILLLSSRRLFKQ